MSSIYTMAHCDDVFQSDFIPVGTYIQCPSCQQCASTLNRIHPPLLYAWDFEFGVPEKSRELKHDCMWGDMWLAVTKKGRRLLKGLNLSLTFDRARLVETHVVRRELLIDDVSQPATTLYWVRTQNVAEADTIATKCKICGVCGRFTRPSRRIVSGLKIRNQPSIHAGPFRVAQNGGLGTPLFVTKEIKKKISLTGITGIAFYPAGEIVT